MKPGGREIWLKTGSLPVKPGELTGLFHAPKINFFADFYRNKTILYLVFQCWDDWGRVGVEIYVNWD